MSEHKITRRVFLGTTAFIVSAPLLAKLPASESKVGLQKILEPGQFFDAEQLTVLVDIADIMIPSTDTPGASDAHVVPVLDALMLTWAGSETKKRYPALIEQVNQLAIDTYGTAYAASSFDERVALITQLDKRAFANKSSELSTNYRKLKEMIFHVYYTSEEANPDYLLIPGSYKGCVSEAEYKALVNQRLGRVT